MEAYRDIRRLARAMSAVVAGGVLAAGIAVGAATLATGPAQADDTDAPHQWCPGNPKSYPYSPGDSIAWDWSVCHTWYPTKYGMGNVNTLWGSPMSIWDGPDPPVEAITPSRCPLPPFPPSC